VLLTDQQHLIRRSKVNSLCGTHLLLACVLAALIIPFFLVTDVATAFETAIDQAGITDVGTTYLDAFRAFRDAPGAAPAILLFILQPWTPTIAALMMCIFVIKRGSAVDLVSRYKPWRGVTRQAALAAWALAIVVIIFVSLLSALLRSWTMPQSAFEWNAPSFGYAFWSMLLATMFVDGGGLAEEGGWRGFAGPLLQAKHRPLKAAVILGIFWAVWHLPVKIDVLLGGWEEFLAFYSNFLINEIGLTIIIMYFSNRVGGSALIAVVLHGLSNDAVQLSGEFVDVSAKAFGETTSILSNSFSYAGTAATLIVAIALVAISKGTLAFTPQAAAPYVDSDGSPAS
jgi:uncharacterized protein